MKKMRLYIIGFIMFVSACTSRDTLVDKSELLGNDYRLFQGTPAWDLAKAIQDADTVAIKELVLKNKKLLYLREPRFGQPLLSLAVVNKNYQSTKTLLELGADPNMQDLFNGDSPLILAAKIGIHYEGADSRFLKLLLKFGGDPNNAQHGPSKTRNTPMMEACTEANLEYVKILIDAGAKVDSINEYHDSPLLCALRGAGTFRYPDIVIYLLEKGADFRRPLYKTIPEGENKYITDVLREWFFDLGSPEYNKKMQIVKFLKKNGMNYWKTPIPTRFLADYPKEYLEKY